MDRKLEEFKKQLANKFKEDLDTTLTSTFGSRYLSKYKDEEVVEKEKIDEFLEKLFKDGTGFVLSGGVGVGKTMALIYVYKRIIQKLAERALTQGDPYLYQFENYISYIKFFRSSELFSKLHLGEEFSFYTLSSRSKENFKPSKIILIDDLGTEYSEPFALSRFEDFIENIYRREDISLVIATNFSAETLRKRDNWLRVMDRLGEICNWLDVRGKSRRHI